MENKSQWSKFVDDYQIAKVEEHNAIMVMNVLDFEAMAAFLTTDEIRARDADRICRYGLPIIAHSIKSYSVICVTVSQQTSDIASLVMHGG